MSIKLLDLINEIGADDLEIQLLSACLLSAEKAEGELGDVLPTEVRFATSIDPDVIPQEKNAVILWIDKAAYDRALEALKARQGEGNV